MLHGTLQPPQLFGSRVVSTHLLPAQSVGVFVAQPVTQVPVEAEHTGAAAAQAVGVDAVLQPPQFAGNVMSVSHPFDGTPSQSAYPALHEAMTQPDGPQAAVAWARLQLVPHAPQ